MTKAQTKTTPVPTIDLIGFPDMMLPATLSPPVSWLSSTSLFIWVMHSCLQHWRHLDPPHSLFLTPFCPITCPLLLPSANVFCHLTPTFLSPHQDLLMATPLSHFSISSAPNVDTMTPHFNSPSPFSSSLNPLFSSEIKGWVSGNPYTLPDSVQRLMGVKYVH